ncbi:hypothetical protein NKH07_29925, partial [Mesorhizobium sp. M1378]
SQGVHLFWWTPHASEHSTAKGAGKFALTIKVVCRDIGPETRKGLSEGLLTAALCHPLEATSALLVQTMIDVIGPQAPLATLQRSIPFEIVTPENI